MRRDEGRWSTFPVRPIAGPVVASRFDDHARTYRIQLDIALAGQEVGFRVDQRGLEPPLPDRSASIVLSIQVLPEYLIHVAHQSRERRNVRRRDEHVDVIRHQHVRVDRACVALRVLLEQAEIKPRDRRPS